MQVHPGLGEDSVQPQTPKSPRSLRTLSALPSSGTAIAEQHGGAVGQSSPLFAARDPGSLPAGPVAASAASTLGGDGAVALESALAGVEGSASASAAAPTQQLQQQQQQAGYIEDAALQPSATQHALMERSDDEEAGAQPVVTPDMSTSQSGDLRDAEAEEQQEAKVSDRGHSEDAAERAERRIYEDDILERARAIERARAATTKACPKHLVKEHCQTHVTGRPPVLRPVTRVFNIMSPSR